ncbi:hypothetical protein OBBRIDRAFT_891195 [Obba rivulosa]|uniref:Nephrocystin 3-like N-terminal domain-containing protein n=1 Tax=Obba rivulosa TaxID=1052685 RepID=A0A8E2DH23_9APHY|nr:hypothetical protein OBBRIDRAFT_891195 [Obba rivulosa]
MWQPVTHAYSKPCCPWNYHPTSIHPTVACVLPAHHYSVCLLNGPFPDCIMASQLNQLTSSTTSPVSHSRIDHDRIDALITSVKGALGIAVDVSSDIPIPGLGHVFSVLNQVLGRIEKMRANKQEAKDAATSIKALRDVLQSSANTLRSQTRRMKPSERHAARRTLESEDVLKERIEALSNQLVGIQDLAEALPKTSRWSRLVYTEQDTDLLKQIRTRVVEATENFKLQGGIAMEDLLREVCYRLQQTEHDRLLRDYNNDLKELKPADASYRSYLTDEKSRLQAGTRETILKDLAEWAVAKDPTHRVLVLHGLAGMGKSSIVHALVKRLDESRRGASFFFNRGVPDCKDPYKVFPTIAHQLAYSQQALVELIVEASRGHLSRSRSQALEHQLEDLIINPLSQLPLSTLPLLLAVDGADECLNEPGNPVPRLLQLLCRAANKIRFLRILIATRPETYIMGALRSSDHLDIITFRDLQKEPDVDKDIRLFIDTEFRKCAATGGFTLTAQRVDATEKLTQLANGVFVYASTVVRFLVDDRNLAVEIYDKLVESQDSKAPSQLYGRLDMLYTAILKAAFDKFRADAGRMVHIHQVLSWCALGKGRVFSPDVLELVGIPTNHTIDIIARLRSVLIVDGEVTPTTELRPYHASFPQFLADSARCQDPAFLVEPQSGHALIASSLLDLLARDDPDMFRDADGNMLWVWVYARTCWDDHLCDGRYTEQLGRSLRRFAETHLEQWITGVEPWARPFARETGAVVSVCRVREWYKENNGPDEGLVMLLTSIINKRIRGLVAQASQSSSSFDEDELDQIKSWKEAGGYTPWERRIVLV